jgi:hypothetical protein
MASRHAPAAGLISTSGVFEPEAPVILKWNAMLTEPLMRMTQPTSIVRILTLSVGVHVGSISLRRAQVLHTLDAESSDPVVFEIAEVDLTKAPFFAAQLLDLDAEKAEPEWSSVYVLTVSPTEGTWASVDERTDLSVGVSLKEPPVRR